MTRRKLSPLERQREAAVNHVFMTIGFGWHDKKCHSCDLTLTAKTPDGRWSCWECWPAPAQLEILP